MKNTFAKFSLSRIFLWVIILFSIFFTLNKRNWKEGVIYWDIISYYAYLPAAFIYNDLTLSYIENPDFKGTVWPETAENGGKVIKTTMGLAILYAPFFFMAHGLALTMDGYPPDGYSMIYSLFLLISNLFYTIIGFVFLRKILLKYFSDNITAVLLLIVFFCTGLFYYTFYTVMSHSYLFCLINIFIFYIIKWHENPSFKTSLFIGLLSGMILLIRPIDIIFCLLFVFYGVYNFKSLNYNIKLFLKQYKKIVLIIISGFCVFFIQMVYWKTITNQWLFWSYSGESFFWTKPHIIEGLFGFRKGLYLYTPILLPATLGLFLLKKFDKNWIVIFPVLFILFTYIILCWWSWWYGGGLSIRPYIDIYGIMAIGLGAFISIICKLKQTILKVFALSVICTLSLYSAFVVNQYTSGSIHWDSMTKESWKSSFGKSLPPHGFYETLKAPDYEKAKATGEE